VKEVPGAITAGLDSHGNPSEGSPVTVSITDGGHAVASGVIYEWQIWDTGQQKWIDGSGTGVTSATYIPGEQDEGHLLQVSLTFTDANGHVDHTTVPAGTVNPVADVPAMTASAAEINEGGASALTLTLTNATDLFENGDDSVTITVSLDQGATLSQAGGGAAVTDNHNGTFTLTAASVADLAGLTITPTSEFEGTVNVGVSAVTHDGTAVSVAGTTSTTLTVDPVAEAGTASAPATLTLNENDTNVAISGVSVGPLAEDGDDTVSTVLAVGHGTLHVGTTGVTVTNNGTASVTVAGSAAAVNTALSGLTYTATTEYEGSDTLNVTVTSKDGSNTSSTLGTASTAITVNPVAEAGTASAPATLTLSENATNVAVSGVSVGPLAEDADDTVSTVLAVGHGTLHVGTTGVTVTNNGTASVTVAGSAAAVNTALSGLTYTATTEYEGSDTLNVTVTSKDGSNTSSTLGTASTAITVNPVAEAGTASAPATLTLNENATNVAVSGVSVGPLAEDADDTVSTVLAVEHGTLHVGTTGVTVTNNGTASVTVAGSAAAVNTALSGLTYTATTEYEGSDTLNVTVTSKDGSNTSSTLGTASTAITVNDGPNDLVATLDSTTAQQGVTMNVTGVKDGGITVTTGLSYKWQDSSDNGNTWTTVGTNSSSYTPGGTDEGKLMQLVVTYVDAGGTESSTYALGMPNDLVATLDSTTAQQGLPIHVTGVTDDGTTVSTGLSYAWQTSSDGGHHWSTVGTNSSSYTPVAGDAGEMLQVVVTYADSGENESATDSLGMVASAVEWKGGTHSWGAASQWSSSGVPTSSDNALVDVNGTYTLTIDVIAAAHSLVLNDTGAKVEILSGHSLTLGGNLTNLAGTFQIDTGGTLKDIAASATITGAFTDNGTVEAGGGSGSTLEIASTAISGTGTFKIDAGANLQLDHADSLNVAFAGSGELILKDPTHFTGTISDSGGSMTAADVIDVAGFDTSAHVGYSSGIVTISETGHTTVNLHVGANSTHWSSPVTDGNGGILIHDPPDSGSDQAVGGVVMQDPGPAASQTIVASAPNQTLTGTGASNSFVFNFASIGHDTVTDFHPGTDTLQFGGALFANAQAALNATLDDGHATRSSTWMPTMRSPCRGSSRPNCTPPTSTSFRPGRIFSENNQRDQSAAV
jgi:phosphoribosylformylglycinamidine (FGAM) synthase PurS component